MAKTEHPEEVKKRIKQYVMIRDKIKAMKEEQEKLLAPMVEIQNILTGWLQDFMASSGCDSVKTEHGTAYTTTRYSASVADGEAFMKYVIASGKYELLDRRANATACRDFTETNGSLPPGVNLSAINTVGVRRAAGE